MTLFFMRAWTWIGRAHFVQTSIPVSKLPSVCWTRDAFFVSPSRYQISMSSNM
jgi:hypothetical protein